MENPFVLYGYKDPKLFCDRTTELNKLLNAINNGRNITLISLRRLGKTGLIKHLFHHIHQENNKVETLYVDIMSTNNINDLVREISTTLILQEQLKSKRFLQNITDLVSGLKAKLLFNPINGSPEIELGYKSESESFNDLNTIFNYIGKGKKPYIIAIDEFQQISNYPEKQVEAWFRKFSQQYPDIRFIFSGSSKHILETMFTDSTRPFYQSSELLYLNRINRDIYAQFIFEHFSSNKKTIEIDDIKEWLGILDTYTFYVQYFFNKLFAQNKKSNTYKLMYEVSFEILKERENIFINYKNLLTKNQFELIKAIGKEEKVKKPNAHDFIKKHNLPPASSINTAIKALIEKQMIYHENNHYRVYDHFFAMWLKSL